MPRWECQRSLWSVMLIACLLAAVPARAGSVAVLGDVFNSAEGLGSFDGTLEYVWRKPTAAADRVLR